MSRNKTLDSILGDDDEIKNESEYHAFRKSSNSAYSLRILFSNGNQQLLPFSLIGMIEYNYKEDAIAIPSSGETLVITGKNLASCMDLLHNRRIAYIKEARRDYKPTASDDPVIHSMVWVDSEIN